MLPFSDFRFGTEPAWRPSLVRDEVAVELKSRCHGQPERMRQSPTTHRRARPHPGGPLVVTRGVGSVKPGGGHVGAGGALVLARIGRKATPMSMCGLTGESCRGRCTEADDDVLETPGRKPSPGG